MGFLSDRRLKKRGHEAIGVVSYAEPLPSDHVSAVVPYLLKVVVSGDEHPEREVELEAGAQRGEPLDTGARLAVMVDPRDPGRIAIDWDRTRELLRGERSGGTALRQALGAAIADEHRTGAEQIEGVITAAAPEDEARAGSSTNEVDDLKQLAELHSTGALTDEEFTIAKRHLLGT